MHPETDRTPGDSTATGLRVRRLGRWGYADACALQENAARSVAAGGPDELLFVQHRAVITLGRGTTPDQLLVSGRRLAAEGISVAETDRGGGATYHGPGQLVGYPIVDLRRRGIGVRSYLRAVEASLVAVLRNQGVEAFTRAGLTGVWTHRGKVAAIGIAVRRGISRHGFALNIAPDLDAFQRIVPCGLRQPVTCLRDVGWSGESTVLCGDIAAALESALQATAAAATSAKTAGMADAGAAATARGRLAMLDGLAPPPDHGTRAVARA